MCTLQCAALDYAVRAVRSVGIGPCGPFRIPVLFSGLSAACICTCCCLGASFIPFEFPDNLTLVDRANALIIHYTSNNHLIKEDEVLLIDAGCEYK
jgi:hypothetical protein